MSKGFAPIIIIVIATIIIGAGVGGFLVFRGEKKAPSDQAMAPEKEAFSSATTTDAVTQSPKTPEKPPAAKTAPPAAYKTFEFETSKQNIFARFEAPKDWAWKDNQPPAAGGGYICRPQSRGNGCILIWITQGAAGMEKEINLQYSERAKRYPNAFIQKTAFVGRETQRLRMSYEITTGVDMAGYPTGGKIEKKTVTESIYYFVAPGFDFFVAANDGWAFADVPEFKSAFERVIKTLTFVDKSSPPEPKPTEQKPTLQPMADDLWCPKQSPTEPRKDVFTGEDFVFQVFGVETVQVGPVSCRACHSRKTYEAIGAMMDFWSDIDLWAKQGLREKWACLKTTMNKQFLNGQWINKQSKMEKWSTQNYAECMRTDGVYQMGSYALCE